VGVEETLLGGGERKNQKAPALCRDRLAGQRGRRNSRWRQRIKESQTASDAVTYALPTHKKKKETYRQWEPGFSISLTAITIVENPW